MKFKRLCSIDYPTTVTGEFGPEAGPWQRLDLVWAEVQDALPSRSEAVRQGLAQARNQTRIRMRWRSDVDSSMRIVVHGDDADTVYQIVAGPAEIGAGRKREIEVVCERYSTAGGA